MLQIQSTARSWGKASNRRQSLEDLKGHLVRVLNAMLESVSDIQAKNAWNPAGVRFLLAGYSWKRRQFVIWELYFDADKGRFHYRTLRRRLDDHRLITSYVMVGDGTKKAKALLYERLEAAGRLFPHKGLDMEPLGILAQMIDDPEVSTIGGAPQVVKVYEYLDAVPFMLEWKESRFLSGRKLLVYEEPDRVGRLPTQGQFSDSDESALVRARARLASLLLHRISMLHPT